MRTWPLLRAELYDKNNITAMDYFAMCFFKMLSGDKRWIKAYPNLPTPLP